MTDSLENTPDNQKTVAKDVHKDITVFKKPQIPTRKKKQKVLDEDTYVEELGKIIQRDFFPDLEKMKAQNDYLDAMEKKDVIKLRQLYAKYSGRKPIERHPSPATFETPQNIHNSQHTSYTPTTSQPGTPSSQNSPLNKLARLSLDQYLNSHTSEDNQSFEEMMTEAQAKLREKYAHLYLEEDTGQLALEQSLVVPPIEQQLMTQKLTFRRDKESFASGSEVLMITAGGGTVNSDKEGPGERSIAMGNKPRKEFNVGTWGYKNRNYIMYIPDGVGMTMEEEMEFQRRRQEIQHCNTRLATKLFDEAQSSETITELAKNKAKTLDGKIGVDGKELLQVDGPNIRGYGFVRTPSPSVSALGASPMMTWGEIEGTPFRLDGSDTPRRPRDASGRQQPLGPAFKMNAPPRREQLAFALADKASERHRDKKRKAMDAAKRQFATSPSPRRPATSSTDRLSTMSPAARQLAASTTARLRLPTSSLSHDSSALRASYYSPSPRSGRTTLRRTPNHSRPGSVRSDGGRTPQSRSGTPKLNLGIRRNLGGLEGTGEDLTNDLLKICVAKRTKASDFF